jgi:acetate kinase
MQWAGIVLDAARNDAAIGTEARISDLNSKVEVWVVPVDEAVILAQAAQAVLGQAAPTKEARL